MQSHSKENGKYVMIYNDITCVRDWTQVCHTQRNTRNFTDTAVSEIFIFVFYFIWGVVHRGVHRGSPWTWYIVGVCGPGGQCFRVTRVYDWCKLWRMKDWYALCTTCCHTNSNIHNKADLQFAMWYINCCVIRYKKTVHYARAESDTHNLFNVCDFVDKLRFNRVWSMSELSHL